jgi:hypothetical protein
MVLRSIELVGGTVGIYQPIVAAERGVDLAQFADASITA